MGSLSLTPILTPSFSTSSQRQARTPTVLRKPTHNHSHIPEATCKTTNNESDPENPNSKDSINQLQLGKRRDVLLGLGSLYAANSFGNGSRFALASPAIPDINKCFTPDDLPTDALPPVNYCPPKVAKTIKDFQFHPPTKLRLRPPAHSVTTEYLEKYKKATALMKALPADDPRNFTQQAQLHCAYCDGGYQQVGLPDLDFSVHFPWIFFPFHRMYLYFHERILGKLINDPTFALPYWNWDSPKGMTLPPIFTDTSSTLYDSLRNCKHMPPTLVDLNYNGYQVDIPPKQLIDYNLATMYKQMVSTSKTAKLFVGSPYIAGQTPINPEAIPHNNLHHWTGAIPESDDNDKCPMLPSNREHTGIFYAAARDPIFYAHHANMDRMWTIKKTVIPGYKEFTDPDWLHIEFYFYDENAELVRVKIKDTLDNIKLGYDYQKIPISWLNTKPKPFLPKIDKAAFKSPEAILPMALDTKISVVVQRPKRSRSRKEKDEEEEVLAIEGIEFESNKFVKFDVYVNDDSDSGPGSTEFARSFVHIPYKRKGKDKGTSSLRAGITELLDDIGADNDDSVMVTLVPRAGNVTIKGPIRIEFDS